MEILSKLGTKLKELESRSKEIQTLAETENRELTQDEMKNWEKCLNDIDDTNRQMALAERQAKIDKSTKIVFDQKIDKEDIKHAIDQRSAINKYLRLGYKGLSNGERDLLNFYESANGMGIAIDPTGEERTSWNEKTEVRATNSVITNPTYFNPVTLAEKFNYTLKAIGPWMEACTVLNDPMGNDLVLPYYNDAGNDGADESEGTDAIASSTDLDAAKITLSNYWTSSTGVKVGWSTLRDANYPVEALVLKPLMDRLARRVSYRATLGTGSTAPKGIAIAAVTGELASKATVPTPTDINNLLRLVDYGYHTGNKSGFMFHSDTMFRMAAQVKSSTYNTEPLWNPNMASGIPNTLYGYRYWVNNNMNTITTAPGNSVLFGDFSHFIIRFVGPVIVTRLEERYAELGQVGFLISQYMDSNVDMIGTTYAPIKKIKNIMT